MSNMLPIDQIERVRNRLAVFLVAAFVIILPLLLWQTIPEKNEQLLTYMIGQLSGMATTVLGFYFVNKVGQDALDAKRTENTATAFEAIKETAKAASGPEHKPDIELKPGETATVAADADGKM